MAPIKLSILDQSIVRQGHTAAEAVAETIATAQLADKLGYHRFWVSEHHNSTFIAGSTPEVLMVKLADATRHIRIGSGGIMLPNHSTLKVAENFRMLETLFPGRIDLGMGRAPGGDRITAHLLNPSNDFAEEKYLQQLEHLQHFFRDSAATQHGPIIAVPQCSTIPMQWVLSSSGGSSEIAARFGLGLAVAKFINGFVQPDVVDVYRKKFEPSQQFPEPHAIMSISVLCGETEEKAVAMRKYLDYILLQFEKGNFHNIAAPDDIANYTFSSFELDRIKHNSGRVISGTPDDVKEQVTRLLNDFGADELIVSTMAADANDRKRSFELLASTFNLKERD